MTKTSVLYGLILATILYLNNSVLGKSQHKDWRLNNRIQIGLEDDSNVEESLKQTESVRGLRLHFHSQASRNWERTSVQLSYQGGYQLYWAYTSENKLINEISAQATFRITEKLKIGIESWGRLKMLASRAGGA